MSSMQIRGGGPVNLDDLAKTSLPAKSYVWRETASTIVFCWKGGLFNRLGRVWVCWGDLRTEHMREGATRERLGNELVQPEMCKRRAMAKA